MTKGGEQAPSTPEVGTYTSKVLDLYTTSQCRYLEILTAAFPNNPEALTQNIILATGYAARKQSEIANPYHANDEVFLGVPILEGYAEVLHFVQAATQDRKDQSRDSPSPFHPLADLLIDRLAANNHNHPFASFTLGVQLADTTRSQDTTLKRIKEREAAGEAADRTYLLGRPVRSNMRAFNNRLASEADKYFLRRVAMHVKEGEHLPPSAFHSEVMEAYTDPTYWRAKAHEIINAVDVEDYLLSLERQTILRHVHQGTKLARAAITEVLDTFMGNLGWQDFSEDFLGWVESEHEYWAAAA